MQVKAWDARLGGSYEQVAALGIGGYGESNPFQLVTGGVGAPPSPPAYLLGIQSFSLLAEVPEPGAVVLLLLGLPLLLLRKRCLKWFRILQQTMPSGGKQKGPEPKDRERNIGIDEEHSRVPKGSGGTPKNN